MLTAAARARRSVGVNGVHEAFFDTECIVEDLDHWNKAVGGAGRVGHHDVIGRVEGVFVDTNHKGCIGVGCWSRNNHAWCAGLNVGSSLGAVREESGGLDDHIYPKVCPRQFGRVALGENLDGVAVHHDAIIADTDITVESTHHRVVL